MVQWYKWEPHVAMTTAVKEIMYGEVSQQCQEHSSQQEICICHFVHPTDYVENIYQTMLNADPEEVEIACKN